MMSTQVRASAPHLAVMEQDTLRDSIHITGGRQHHSVQFGHKYFTRISGVTLGGRTAPGDTIQGGKHPNKIIFVAEFRKNTGKMGVVRRRQLKKSSLSRAMTKQVVIFFQEKIG